MDSTYQTGYYDYAASSSADAAAAAGAASFLLVFWLIWLVATVVMVVALWKLFTKAGKPGWAAIVPIYNVAVMLEISGRPVWWLVLFLVPIFGTWIGIVMMLDFVRSYGKSMGFGVVSVFFPYVTLPIMAFDKSKYVGPAAKGLADTNFLPAPERTGAKA